VRSLPAVRVLVALGLASALAEAPAMAQPATAQPDDVPPPLARGYRSRVLAGGWGQSWLRGWPGYGQAVSDIQFVSFYPQIGWFVTRRLELYGEGTMHVYWAPSPAVLSGVTGIGGRVHFWSDRSWTPYVFLSGGLAWTSLDVIEVDRVFNFQVAWGAGLRQITRRGPGWMFEFRNHHISNAGTRGENLGVNAATVVVGVHWVIR
jgi:lipid A 3-O-deacylase